MACQNFIRRRHGPLRHPGAWTGWRSSPTWPTSRKRWTWRTRPARSSASSEIRSIDQEKAAAVGRRVQRPPTGTGGRFPARDGNALTSRAAWHGSRMFASRPGHVAHARLLLLVMSLVLWNAGLDGEPPPLRRIRRPPGHRRGQRPRLPVAASPKSLIDRRPGLGRRDGSRTGRVLLPAGQGLRHRRRCSRTSRS